MTANGKNLFYGDGAAQLVQRMGEAASNFLASLSTDQRAKTILPMSDQESRTEWHYTPTPRNGITFNDMDRNQQRLCQKLVATGLSRSGYVTASTIMGLETTLDRLEGWTTDTWWRDSHLYHLTIFDTPDGQKPWGWRFEGHHISLNYTIAGGRIVAPTPTFFGSNPASSPLGRTSWLRPLGATEDLGRELVYALDEHQRHHAIVTNVAPPDLVSLNRPKVLEGMLPTRTEGIEDPPTVAQQFAGGEHWMKVLGTKPTHLEAVRYTTKPKGIAASEMTDAQQEIMLALIGEYLYRMPDELAEIEMKSIQARGIENMHFVWAGPTEPQQPHYYRLQGPRFLIEHDNIQNDANHVHSVWRDPENDFGVDVLAHHYEHSH
ncbi:MAG: DUF3500 domain-containing protein [Chloroflexota bacterium]